jgi:hypothetical protein
MARRKKIEEHVVEDDAVVLEAADDVTESNQEEELVEFQASGEASFVPDPISTGSTRRKADKSNGMPMEKLGKTGVIQQVVDAFAAMTPGQAAKAYEGLMADGANKASISAKGDAKAPIKLHTMANVSMKEDIAALFKDKDGLNEDFFEDATTLFEAALHTKATVVEEALKEQYAAQLEEQVLAIRSELSEQVSGYMDYVAEQWIEENKLEAVSAIKVEIAESFMSGLKSLFEEHNIKIEDEQVDVVAAYEEQVQEIQGKLDESVNRILELQGSLAESSKKIAFSELSGGLTLKQRDEFAELAESVEYENGDDYVKKLQVIKEANFKSAVSESKDTLDDAPVEVDPETPVSASPAGPMAAYAQAISRTLKR